MSFATRKKKNTGISREKPPLTTLEKQPQKLNHSFKGIPIGGNANPLTADLFLSNLEYKYIDKLVSSKSPENLA